MSKVSLVARITAQEGKADEMIEALKNLMGATDEEPGLEIYAAHQDTNNPEVFWFYELYTDNDALGVHGQGERMKAAMGAMGGLLAGAPEINLVTPVAAKGIEI